MTEAHDWSLDCLNRSLAMLFNNFDNEIKIQDGSVIRYNE